MKQSSFPNTTGNGLHVALYDRGRADSVAAVRALAAARVDLQAIDEQTISNELSTRGRPDSDLIIRTGGEDHLQRPHLASSV